MPQGIIGQLDQRGFFKNFPMEIKVRLGTVSQAISIKDKEILYQAGDEPRGIFGVLRGCIKLSTEDSQGKYYLYGLAQPGWWFSEVPALDGAPHTQIASAVGDTQLILIPRKELINILDEHPELYKEVVIGLCKRLRIAGSLMEETAFSSLAIRLAKLFLRLHKNRGDSPTKLSQEELAASLGVTRQSIHRILKEWQKDSWISIGYGDVDVLKPERLQELVDASE